MITIHTANGSAQLIGSWGNGKAPAKNFGAMPATLVADNGDGHYDAWKITGPMMDQAREIARYYVKGERVVEYSGGRLVAVNQPEDFWIELPNGDFAENTAKYPEILAW
jgi:hypothetical protein